MVQAQQTSTNLMMVGMCPLFMGIKARVESQFMSPEMYGGGVTLTKNFDDCIVQFMYQ